MVKCCELIVDNPRNEQYKNKNSYNVLKLVKASTSNYDMDIGTVLDINQICYLSEYLLKVYKTAEFPEVWCVFTVRRTVNTWCVFTVGRTVNTHHWFKITLPNTDQAHDKHQGTTTNFSQVQLYTPWLWIAYDPKHVGVIFNFMS